MMKFIDKENQSIDLVLYTTPTCGYCHLVINKARELGFELPLADASEEEPYRELIRVGGKSQVPCLVVNGKAMYESRDIMRFLENDVRSHLAR